MFLGVDPGDTTGVALISLLEVGATPKIEYTGQLNVDEFLHFLHENVHRIKVIVCEDFTLFKHKATGQSGSKMPSSQIIGMLKLFALEHHIRLIMQPAAIKPMAERKTKLKP